MIILDEPYASAPLLDWMEETAHPVLRNSFTQRMVREGRALNEVSEAEARAVLEAGDRVYTNSENALAWILEHVNNPVLTEPIRLFKDKAAMREKLRALNPRLFYATVARDELTAVAVEDLPLPVVLKPAVGFCSMGVYVIESAADWDAALHDIARCEKGWHERYPESVVGSTTYVIEGYLTGTEFALDAFFDEEGDPHILNILRHDFADSNDTSDRMYLINEDIVRTWEPRFTEWLAQVNRLVGARNFPVHVELRVQDGEIAPIEFNPLRFAGLGGTDVTYYAVGLRTYAAFLEDHPVDLQDLYAEDAHAVYSMSLLNPPAKVSLAQSFDGEALCARFSHVLAYVPFNPEVVGFYGFLFLKTTPETADELDFLLHSDLRAFIK